MERDLEHGHAKKGGKGNFNSHAHVERDYLHLLYAPMRLISTHTLTWSVTFLKFCFVSVPYFNSHAHVERDGS